MSRVYTSNGRGSFLPIGLFVACRAVSISFIILQSPFPLVVTKGLLHVTRNGVPSDLQCREISVSGTGHLR